MSLIDREALIAEYDRVHVGPPGGARKLMVDAPEVLPEIIRCKDCFWFNREHTWCDHPNGLITFTVEPTDYCCHAERRTDEQTD